MKEKRLRENRWRDKRHKGNNMLRNNKKGEKPNKGKERNT